MKGLAGWKVPIVGSVLVVGFLVGGIVFGLFPPASGPADERPARTSAWAVVYSAADGTRVRAEVHTEQAGCDLVGNSIDIVASSGGVADAFHAAGDPRHLAAITLRFGDLVYLARANPPMDGDTLRLDHLDGQIHRWTDGAPGEGVSPDATLTGTITCERMAE